MNWRRAGRRWRPLSPLLPSPAPLLHPNLATAYKERVARLQDALRQDPDGGEALEIARGLIGRVELRPAAGGPGLEIELVGEIAAMLRLASGDGCNAKSQPAAISGGAGLDLFACSVKVVAGTGNHRQLTLPPVPC